MNETQWLGQVRHLAELYGWEPYHTHRSDRSDAGWPDLVLAKGTRTIFPELKSETGRVSPEQKWWLIHLAGCGFEVGLWRPSDRDQVIRILGPRQERAVLAPALVEEWTRKELIRPSRLRNRR